MSRQARSLARGLALGMLLTGTLLGGLVVAGETGDLLAAFLNSQRIGQFGAALAILLMGVAVLYVLHLNRTQAELRAHLEDQLRHRNRAEEALRASEALYHSLVETLPQNIFRKDCESRFTFANQRFCAELGRPLDAIIGRTDRDFFPAELAEKYRRDDRHVMETGTIFDTVEEHVTPDGQTRYVRVMKTPLHDSLGRVNGTQAIYWDVTEERRAVEALAASEERFALAVRGTNDGLWDWDLRTREIYFSPRFKELLGFEGEELPDQMGALEALVHPEDRDRVGLAVRAHLRHRIPYDVEYRLRTKAGVYRWFRARGQAVGGDDGRATRMAGSISDIHDRKAAEDMLHAKNQLLQEMALSERMAHEERKQAQSRMVETAKLAGLGQMVAGVAHEINNPLSYVGNNVAVLQRDASEIRELLELYREADPVLDAHDPEHLARIRDLCERVDIDYTLENLSGLLDRTREGLRRIQNIVKDLRVFARLDEGDLAEVDLNTGIESTINIIHGYAKRKQVRLTAELEQLPLVGCFAAKINQVIMNLIANAIEACEPGGEVMVRSCAEPGGVRIEVIDDGCGIDPAVRERIFDPFFTTKPIGVGTGLGLSISYGIVQDHGGTIEVSSAPGSGTRFLIRLPVRPQVSRTRSDAPKVDSRPVSPNS
ncbi:hypothetical protein BH23PLA1_BH23PLA1_21590 [soil metagenome]